MSELHELPLGRDIFDAAEHLAAASNERLQLLVLRDADMIRDVAKALLNVGAGVAARAMKP